MTTSLDLNKIMARVQALLAKADATNYPEEATAYRAKAEELMREYRIAEEQLIAVDQTEIKPEMHEIWLGPVLDETRPDGRSAYIHWCLLMQAAANHAGAMMAYRRKSNPETGEFGVFAVLVGYAGDLRLAEIIYSSARIVFGERVEPRPDPNLSDRENAYRLRSAGITRDRVAKLIWGETSHARAAQVGKWYKEECLRRGETPVLDGRGINAALYREQFADAFVKELEQRLRAARDAADAAGGALVLAGRRERVEEAFYNEFPHLRPNPEPSNEVAKRNVKPYWETAAGRRDLKRLYSPTAIAARSAGKSAAQEVPLDRVPPAQRIARPQAKTLGN